MSTQRRAQNRYWVEAAPRFQPSAYSVPSPDYGAFSANPFDTSNDQEEAAAKAVEYALKNVRPIGYSDVLRVIPPHANFWLAPVFDVHAYFAAAYWLAAAALMTGEPSLRQLAEENLSSGEYRNFVFVQGAQDGVESILDAALVHLAKYPTAKPAYEAVMRLRDPNFRAAETSRVQEASVTGMAAGTAEGSIDDAGRAAEILRGAVTGEKPQGMSDWAWFWERNKWLLILGGAATVGVLVIGRPYMQAYLEAKRESRRIAREQRGESSFSVMNSEDT